MATLLFQEGHVKEQKSAHAVHLKKQLSNNIIDGMAATRPQAIFAELPISSISFEAGYRRVTYRVLANAINGAAWWLTKELGPGKDFQTLSYMGWNDIRYVVLILGAVKAGYKVSWFVWRLLISKPKLTALVFPFVVIPNITIQQSCR